MVYIGGFGRFGVFLGRDFLSVVVVFGVECMLSIVNVASSISSSEIIVSCCLECFVGLVEAEAPWAETKVSWVRARALPCKIRVPGLAFDRIHRLRISMCLVNSATHGYTAPSIYSKMTHTWDSPPSGKHEDYYMGWLNYHPSLSCTRQGFLLGEAKCIR